MIDPSAKVQRVTLSEQVEGFIREHITSQKIAPGQSLPSSTQLAERFGVSRAIVREAMKSLEAKGMITIANGKRPIVSAINNQVLVDYFDRVASQRSEALIELLELRRGIEVQGAELAATRITDQELDHLWQITGKMRNSIGDIERYLDFDLELHLAIVQASRNRMLFHLLDSIKGPLRDTQREGQLLNSSDEMREHIQVTHEVLVQLIADRDVEGAGRYMATHFDGSIMVIEQAMAKDAAEKGRAEPR